MDNDTIIINENDLELAKFLCSSISNSQVRNRAVANVVAAEVASRFFDKNYDIDIETGLHNISKVLEEVDISDIYVNGSYIDVRVYFNDGEMSIPKLHYDIDVCPVAYMFIKLSQDLSKGIVTGFVKPESVDKNNINDEYYYVSKKSIVSFSDIKLETEQTSDMTYDSNEELYKFLEGSLNYNDKIQLIKKLIHSKNARIALQKLVKAQSIFNFVSVNQEEKITSDNNEKLVVIENNQDSTDITDEDLDDLFITDSNEEENNILAELEYSTEVTPSGADIIAESDIIDKESLQSTNSENYNNQDVLDDSSEEQINDLFTGEQEGIPVSSKKKPSGIFMLLLICILVLSGAFLWYTNSSFNQNNQDTLSTDSLPNIAKDTNSEKKLDVPQKDAMPNETVETVPESPSSLEQGNSLEIPAIERHLDASVLVSNLKVDWEVPAGYVSNTSAKKYLVKIGKVIQLNLKTELLLLNKPPIANKISVELAYNPNSGKFDIVGIVESSGEKTVDEVILRTIKSALSMSISSNIEAFSKLQGNPVLIIHL